MSCRIQRQAVVAGALLLALAWGAGTPEPPSERDLAVEGAVLLATQRLAKDPGDASAAFLARLAAVLDPTNEVAPGLIAAASNGLQVEEPDEAVADNGVTFSKFLVGMADKGIKSTGEKTRLRSRLCYWAAVQCDPKNELARQAVLRLKLQDGKDLDVEGMLSSLAEANAPKTVAAEGAPKALDAAGERVRDALASRSVEYFAFGDANPFDVINRLNREASRVGLAIVPSAKALRVDSEYTYDGVKQYYGSFPAAMQHQFYRLNDVSLLSILNKFCRVFQLGYKFGENNKVFILDGTDKESAVSRGYVITADQLMTEFSGAVNKSLQKYKGHVVEVSGTFSGIGKGTASRQYVALNGDRVRVIMSSSVAADKRVSELRSLADQEKDRKTDARKSRRNISRYYSSYSDTRYMEYDVNIEVTATGTVTGYSANRIIIENCDELYWENKGAYGYQKRYENNN